MWTASIKMAGANSGLAPAGQNLVGGRCIFNGA